MKRLHLIAAILASSLALAVTASTAAVRTLDVSANVLNSTPLFGPEGVVAAPDGSLYVGNHDGRIVHVSADGVVTPFADLNTLPGPHTEQIGAIGLAMDREGDIYAAAFDFNGGSVLKVIGPGKLQTGKVVLYRHGIGLANFIFIDDATSMMYVSNSSMFGGSVFKFDMNDLSRVGSAVDPTRELVGEFPYANGLALSADKQWLYVAETTKGRISKVYLKTGQAHVFAELGGWLDGIGYDPKKQLLYVCDNKGGRILAVNSSATVVGEVHLIGKEGQCAPASLVFRDPNTIVYTDLWKASLWRALLRRPQYHSYIYQISVTDVVK